MDSVLHLVENLKVLTYMGNPIVRKTKDYRYVNTMLQKLLKCEVKAAWYDNYTIWLTPKFYVKSNFGEFKWSKMSFWALSEVLNFNFSKFEPFCKSQINRNSKLSVSEIVKVALFQIQILPKLISRKNE